jgi:hypothetical protein
MENGPIDMAAIEKLANQRLKKNINDIEISTIFCNASSKIFQTSLKYKYPGMIFLPSPMGYDYAFSVQFKRIITGISFTPCLMGNRGEDGKNAQTFEVWVLSDSKKFNFNHLAEFFVYFESIMGCRCS